MMSGYTVFLLAVSVAFGLGKHNIRTFIVVACVAGFVIGLSAIRSRHGQYFVSKKPLRREEVSVLIALPVIGALCLVGSAIFGGHDYAHVPPVFVAVGVAAALSAAWFGLYLWMSSNR